jgi:hypothetical protein
MQHAQEERRKKSERERERQIKEQTKFWISNYNKKTALVGDVSFSSTLILAQENPMAAIVMTVMKLFKKLSISFITQGIKGSWLDCAWASCQLLRRGGRCKYIYTLSPSKTICA